MSGNKQFVKTRACNMSFTARNRSTATYR